MIGIVALAPADAAIAAIGRLAASLQGCGSGAVALAVAQADTMADVIEAAFTDLGLDGAQVKRGRTLVAERLRQVADPTAPHDRPIVGAWATNSVSYQS